MSAMAKAYEEWVATNCEPMGSRAIYMLSAGVVAMFSSAGLLTHARYTIEFEARAPVAFFWLFVAATAGTVLAIQCTEDKKEKRKEGPYSASWRDIPFESGLYAKINRAGAALHAELAESDSTSAHSQRYGAREAEERAECAATVALRERFELLRQQSAERAMIRSRVVQLVTRAAEEREALPEELTTQLNKILYDVDDVDAQTSTAVEMESVPMDDMPELPGTADGMHVNFTDLATVAAATPAPQPMPAIETLVDAASTPVVLEQVRSKLGEISRTTMLRIVNCSTEPLLLQKGQNLSAGKYVVDMVVSARGRPAVTHQFYPPAEISPRSEVVVVARSGGGWVATSGIEGELVYTNRRESWKFIISFCNLLLNGRRAVNVSAVPSSAEAHNGTLTRTTTGNHEHWQATRDELDRKENNECIITIDVKKGAAAAEAAAEAVAASTSIKTGFLVCFIRSACFCSDTSDPSAAD
eukprot:SAG11_NODE_1729_length_4365_cov_2.317628_3_plen_472_part_00